MLPDIPTLKKRLLKVQMKFVHDVAREQMPAFGGCLRLPIFEGNKNGIERATGDSEIREFDRVGAEIVTAPHKDDLGATFAKLYEMGRQIAEKTEKNSFQYMTELLTRVGQATDAKGKPTAEAMLEMLEKVEIPLGADGNLDMSGMNMVVSPDAYRTAVKAWTELQSDPRFQELMKRKEAAARVREANRKLVG